MNEKINMDNLTENEEFPEVKENAIEAFQEKAQENEDINDEFKRDESGEVLKNKDGTLKKKRGRKKGAIKSEMNVGKEKREKAEIEAEKTAQEAISSVYAATVVSGILEQLQTKIISDEFIYDDIERIQNIKAWSDMFDYYGGVNLSPPQYLAINHAAIILSRAVKPKTSTKLKLMGAWISDKFHSLQGYKNALFNRRADVIGENDLGEKESEQS